jgi:hypothetical protein
MDRSLAEKIKDRPLGDKIRDGVKQTARRADRILDQAGEMMNLDTDWESPAEEETPPPLAEKHDPATDCASRRLNEATTQLSEAMPLIERAGFRLESLAVEMGVPPKLIPRFSVVKRVPDPEREALAKEAGGNRLGHAVLEALVKAGRLQRAVNVPELSFSHIEVLVGIMPKVRLVFS